MDGNLDLETIRSSDSIEAGSLDGLANGMFDGSEDRLIEGVSDGHADE